jgi:multidrug transporter EmrE-like cation transporter
MAKNGTSPPLLQESAPEESHGNSVVGISLAVGANFLVSVSLNVQKFAHNKNTQVQNQPPQPHPPPLAALTHACLQNLPYTKLPLWWVGMLLNALGELGNLLALGFAPASVVTPVGAVGVVFNAIFASLFLKEPFRKIDCVGLVLIVTGIVVVVLCSKESNVQLTVAEAVDTYFNRAAFYVYVALLCGSCAWLVTLYKRGLGSQYMSMWVLQQRQRFPAQSSPAVQIHPALLPHQLRDGAVLQSGGGLGGNVKSRQKSVQQPPAVRRVARRGCDGGGISALPAASDAALRQQPGCASVLRHLHPRLRHRRRCHIQGA